MDQRPNRSHDRRSETAYRHQVQYSPPSCVGTGFDLPILYFVFFVSGGAALIYEISWSRQIGLLFGHTVHAAAVVLGSYFAGMAIGYAVGARYASRQSPLMAYGVVELVAAAWACLIPSILSLTEASSLFAWLASSSPTTQTGLRGAYCFLLLLPATTALGATLPFVAEFLSPKGRLPVGRISVAYAFNTAGAFVGVACATLFLLVSVGVRGSSYLAAGLSAFSGVAALALSRRSWSAREAPSIDAPGLAGTPEPTVRSLDFSEFADASTSGAPNWFWWSMIAGLCGFATLALEVLYTRLFSLVFHNSTYTFGAVVAVFLAALAIGAALVPSLLQRVAGETLVGATAWLGAIAIAASGVVFIQMTGLEYFKGGESFSSYLIGGMILVAVVVLPPVTLVGMLLPLIWQSLPQSTGAGYLVGRLTMVNTLAASLGSLAASFVLLPTFGLWPSFSFVAFVFVLVSGAVFRRRRQTRLVLSGGLACLALIYITGVTTQRWTRPTSMADEDIIRRWESAYGWVDVVRSRDNGVWKVRQNLHYRHGATGEHAIREQRLAHIPLLLHEQPSDVLFLGLGTGITASGALRFNDVQQIEIVELIPQVVEAAQLLSELNEDVVEHPKVKIHLDDARHHLLANNRRHAVIVSDLFVPWESQTGYLYTIEHYQITRHRLKAGGLFCQWLPLYQMGSREFELIADSFSTVFPHTTLWWGQLEAHGAIVALIGSEEPITVDLHQLRNRFEALRNGLSTSDPYLTRAEHLFELCLGKWPRRNPKRLNTDEHPRVEFLAPRSHGDRDLLIGQTLRQYFDTVLARLPEAMTIPGIQNGSANAIMRQRRSGQHLILFGE